ncbi:SDR family NAD(P)-dependent oxidoreductase [Lentzea aerocolonigenes]|uniref:SDR family NAD(P)-dependent oxidoreductase n=1 Tax=Lentzea aerocolonigenes TaxID=68170 RepID=UPI0005ED1364|nr:SDR family NAD(P)-dependent oxidoreductase [Lentzea aerocolonigenes]
MRPRILITGGAGGFGRVFAEEMCRAGAAVVITGRNSTSLQQARHELLDLCADVAAVTADSTDQASAEAAVDAAEAAFGPLDVLVNNAGVTGPTGPAWEIGQDDWWRAVEVNLRGTALMTAAVLTRMLPRKRGRIVNIVCHTGKDRLHHATACSVSRAAVIKLTEGLASETRGHGVTVLSYHPGLVDLATAVAGSASAGSARERSIAAWGDGERAAGRGTPAAEAASVLRRIVEGKADHRSGEHLTVEDPLVRTAWEPMPLSW